MTAITLTTLDIFNQTTLICRGCLAESGEMKNMFEWGLSEDFFKVTNLEKSRVEGISEFLCSNCVVSLNTCKEFREKCHLSDVILKSTFKKKKRLVKPKLKNEITSFVTDKNLLFKITAPNTEAKIYLPCPYTCAEKFLKKTDLIFHMKKAHCVSNDFAVELQYYCSERYCKYSKDENADKWFTGRKFLNQHYNRVHKERTFHCQDCNKAFSTESDYNRHSKTCNMIYICQICDTTFADNEKLMVHLLRKHPNLHKMYKDGKKRQGNDVKETIKKPKIAVATETSGVLLRKSEDETVAATKSIEIECADSPKRSLATQIPEDITNDVSLPFWQTKTDEISTQTVFEDLLSVKSQNSDYEIYFSENVSLSDIQTQTFPVEFGLSRSNKETQSCINTQTQSPDLSIKETQTCFCHDSPKPNFRMFDSFSSTLTSTETQTADHRFSVKSDVLLSFSSAETQTHFDGSSDDGM